MAGATGAPPHPLDDVAALTTPWEVSFFQALRRIEAAYPAFPRIGSAARPADEPVRFGQDPSLAFAPAALSSFDKGDGQKPSRLGVQFFGLFGPNGPMPLHLTEYVRERLRVKDEGFARFADVFHHRLIGLFYRAWATAEPVVSRDRPEQDRFAEYVASLIGLGLSSLKSGDAIPDRFKLAFAGRLCMQSRNAEGLEAMLIADLGVSVRLEEFVGGWVTIAERDRWRLGPGRQAGRLGQSAFLGQRVWQCDQRFRLVIGPVDEGGYDAFLPGGAELERVRSIVRGYIGDEMAWDVRLIAKSDVRQPMKLQKRGRLGWSSWLGPRAHVQPLQDVVFEPLPLAS